MELLIDIILALLVVALGVLIWAYLKTGRHKEFYDRIPGPKTTFLFGNTLDFADDNFLDVTMDYMKKFGDIVQIWFGSFNVKILITDHKLLETLVTSNQNINKSDDYSFVTNWLGQGLLTSEGAKWKKHRKIITPAFHFQILEKFVDIFEGPTSILIKKMRQRVGLKSVDMYPLVSLNSLDIICETSMGTKVNAQENEDSEYVNAVREVGRISLERTMSPFKQFDCLFRFTRDYYREVAALKILHGYTNSVIEQRKKLLMEMHETSKNVEQEWYSKKKLSFLDILLMSRVDGEPISDKEIREEVDTFLFEGHDTTASGIAFILYCLVSYPDIQQKVYDEQKDLFGDEKNPKITLNDLQDMKYLELVIKECLRLYPPVPFFGRLTTKDMEVDGQIYPKGLTYTVNIYGIHRNPKYFKNPNKFDPLRFGEMDSKLPYAYIPFSAGPRNCIGQKFAMFEMKFVVSSILRHFKLEPPSPKEEPQLAVDLVLKSKNGVKISFQERN